MSGTTIEVYGIIKCVLWNRETSCILETVKSERSTKFEKRSKKALLSLVTACVAAPTGCDGDALNTTMIKCFTENGFSFQDVSRLLTLNNGAMGLNDGDLKLFCDKRDSYTKSTFCIADNFNRCQLEEGALKINASMIQTAKTMDIICDDPSLKFDCIVQLTKYHAIDLQACITSKYDFTKELLVKTMQQVTCESATIGLQCAYDIMKTCDEHTATVYETASALSIPAICSPTVI
ncbi:unnamed protein product [Lymnaea stagnalis]|uniref:DUF19 domain-containing protein n=1 Tax=Lymnaea stagnalis TaxID=6523 RepID=A0AAV2HRT0_LYMST